MNASTHLQAPADGSHPPLPVELFHSIGALVSRTDLPTLSLGNKLLNDICTPLLYHDIELYDYETALKCVTTLTMSAQGRTYRRDLPLLVRRFFLHEWCSHNAQRPGPAPLFDDLLVFCVTRMVNLEALRCFENRECTLKLLLATIVKTMPALKHLELFILNTPQLGQTHILGGFVQFASALARGHAALSSLPKLSVCKLYLPRGVPAIVSFAIRILLASSSSVIHTLTVTARDPADAQSIIPLPLLSRLPVLKRLEIEASMLLVRDFGCRSALRSLAVNEHILTTTGDAPTLPSDSWPLLEELACSPELITSFLPEQDEPRRPIHTLRLCNVTYERNGGQHSMYYTPPWKGIVWAVEHTVYSAVPFKHLTFQVDGLSVTVLRELLPYLRTLETLVIVDMSSPDPDEVFALGAGFVAHLPRLHTLLLSDVSFKVYGQNCAFRFARELVLQRGWLAEFARCSPVLRRVAFTTEFEWEKGAHGGWYPSELPRDVPVGQEESEEAQEHEEDADIDSGEEVGSDAIGEGGGSNGDGTTSVHVEVAYLGQL